MIKNIHIMYADDDEDDVYLFSSVIDDIGIPCSLSVFPTGVALIEALHAAGTHPDVIFMDINMPFKNGLECVKEIRENTAWTSIPVFIFSTSEEETYRQAAVAVGASGYVHKPSSYSMLKEKLKALIGALEHGVEL